MTESTAMRATAAKLTTLRGILGKRHPMAAKEVGFLSDQYGPVLKSVEARYLRYADRLEASGR